MSNDPFRTWIRDNSEPWHWNALCANIGGGFWHPEKGESAGPARLICIRCPVREQCLQWALDHGEKDGIYGGVTPNERRRMVKERAA